ncbi:hypothetical protein [Actinocorallia longicatena]|uniref:Uncharacterized protein n=1 Tax=Actinocorallia longicatena TaxID=111803 RepID=A0ABP6QNP0_9ACTN
MNGLCLTLEAEGGTERPPPRQAARAAVSRVFDTALHRSGLNGPYTGHGLNGLLMVVSGARVDALPTLIRELDRVLAAENTGVSGTGRLRLRLALTTGLLMPGAAGIARFALAEGSRMVAGDAVRSALRSAPGSDLAVIASDPCFREVILRWKDRSPASVWRRVRPQGVRSSTAWLHLPRRLPAQVAVREPARPSGLGCATLVELACAAKARGEDRRADRCLNEAAEADPGSPLPLIVLALWEAEAGDPDAARRLMDAALGRIGPGVEADVLPEIFETLQFATGVRAIMEVLAENGFDPDGC